MAKKEKISFRFLLSEPGVIPRVGDSIATLPVVPSGNGYDGAGMIRNFEISETGIYEIDLVWTASKGRMPKSGPGAKYIVIGDERNKIIAISDLGAPRWVAEGKSLQVSGLRFNVL